jgi:hypothetical protein
MKLNCPKCYKKILANDINLSENICFCVNCDEVFHITEMIAQDEITEAEKLLSNPPKGTWVKRKNDRLVIGSSTRSKDFFITLLFALVFSIISIPQFFMALYAALFENLHIVFLLLHFIFFAVSCMLIWLTIYSLFGKVEIIISGNPYIFYGVGIFGSKKYINFSTVKKISKHTFSPVDGGIHRKITIEGERYIEIPTDSINVEKEDFLYKILQYKKSGLL